MRTLLLGAGASVEAGVPNATRMVRMIHESFKVSNPRIAAAIQVVIGGLRFHRSVEQGEPFQDVDIEDVYGTLRMLEDRNSTLLSPFVGSWSHAVQSAERPDLHEVARSVAFEMTETIRDAAKRVADSSKNASELFISSEGFRDAFEQALSIACGSGESIFRDAADAVLKEIIKSAWVEEPERVAYLGALIASSTQAPLWIASLNYDNAIELAASNAGFTVDLGLREGEFPIRYLDDSQICLAKLHGSVSWGYDYEGQFHHDRSSVLPALIFGSGNKLRVDGPYLDLLFAFRERLKQTDELWICGYSFRDTHINYLLVGWLKTDSSRLLKVVDPCLTSAEIEHNVNRVMPRGWHIVPGHLASRIQVENVGAGDWVAKYFSA